MAMEKISNNKERQTIAEHLWEILEPTQIFDSKAVFLLNISTYRTSYRKFYEMIKFDEWDEEADKVYQYLVRNNMSLSGCLAKSKGREDLIDKLEQLYKKQRQYIKEKLKERKKDFVNNYKASDADIAINEYIGNNSVEFQDTEIDPISSKSYYSEYMNRFAEHYNKLLDVVAAGDDFPLRSNCHISLNDAFQYEKEHYLNVKKNKEDWFAQESCDNVYRNLYMLARNKYMQYYYVPQLIDVKLFDEIKKYECCEKQTQYSLKDLAKIYRHMLGLPNRHEEDEKIYGRVKKLFEKKNYTKKFKRDNKFLFDEKEIFEGICAYIFLKKKNVKEEDFGVIYDIPQLNLRYTELEKIIRESYANLLEILVNKHGGEVEVFADITDFYRNEYIDIFGTLNHEYQNKMLNELIEGMERIWALYQGFEETSVYIEALIKFKTQNRD